MSGNSILTIYVEVAPVRSEWMPDNVYRAKVSRLFKRRPLKPAPDTHLLRLDLTVPHDLFGKRVEVTIP